MTLTEWAKVAAIAGPFVTVLSALAAGIFAWFQLDANRRNQRETTAKTIFREYLQLTIAHADYARGGISRFKGVERESYKWFVANLLWATEEMLEFATSDDVWRRNLQLHAMAHREYLTSDEFKTADFFGYSDNLLHFLEEAFE